MALISLVEYAEKHGKNPDTLRQLALRGKFKTARKIGRNWAIDEDEPYIDGRIKSGKYIGWREGSKVKTSSLLNEE